MRVESGAKWVDQAASPRAIEMRGRLSGIEQDIVRFRRERQRLASAGLDCSTVDAEIGRAKQSIGRIRAHLKRKVYG